VGCEHPNRPLDKENNKAFLIDIAVPGDRSLDEKEQEKVYKY